MGPGAIQYAATFPLPSTLAGTSINVTVNGSTLSCPMIYTSDSQLAAILPSAIPTGTGTLVVSYNGDSDAGPITVVTTSPGIFTVNQQGSGPGVIQDGSGNANALDSAFTTGQTVVVWATGLGPISGSDADVPPTGNLPGVTVTASVGGQPANVVYAGRSQDAGLDQINITLPAGVTGCFVPVYLVATPAEGTAVTSNFVTVSIAPSGTFCVDSNFPDIFIGNGYLNGLVSLTRLVTISGTSDTGTASFAQYAPDGSNFVDVTNGSCNVSEYNGGVTPPLPKILDAGPVLNVEGPTGTRQMAKSPTGLYGATFATSPPLYLNPGGYTIDNGNGGPDVGDFQLSLNAPPAFTWSNESSITTVDRSQPLRITWTGGDPNGQVQVSGRSYADSSAYVLFTCYARDSDQQLTVPATILSLLPPTSNQANTFAVSTTTSVNGAASGLNTLTGSFTYAFSSVGLAFR